MYSFEGRIRYSECDEAGRLSLFSLMNYLQDCSTFQSDEMGMGLDGLTGRGLAWVLANWRIEVDRLPAFGERIRVSTWCYELTRAHALRNFQLEAGGERIVRANTQWFVYDSVRGRATRVPEDQRVYLSDEPPIEMAPLARRIVPAGEGERAPEIVVARRDLDTNHHVNNARYVAFALEALEARGAQAPACPLTLQVQYRTMAFLGDKIVPVVHPCEGGWDVELRHGADGATSALVRIQGRKELA
ncbi:thioesterase [Thermophilibacter sp. ET337]|uniref:acyl-[acyl-carrier-protein] thioesterase n=1 Tax=Thermophilibacter sp. ET337 TaxID=2973084 RepID=UPI0021AC3746|nr:acyl-ACP thioesterase domain-containing protein [Thermophilibacter sp. ET337]MCR8908593.1 thioesterase [Thermophilibacter sp. ET337]